MSVMDKTKETRGKENNQHIQVFVRVRPVDYAEKLERSSTAIDIPSNREIVVRERPHDKIAKKFHFDRVFGPSSKQIDLYNTVVSPLVAEVLAGYNCTVFAYGQTGTGKTYTMEGQTNDPELHWQSDSTAGIIPRALSHLFDELIMLEAHEYTVRVSFVELYNEELFDLLAPGDDAPKLRLYEDASKKGAIIIHGSSEVTVNDKNAIYKILEKGSEKRQTAATLMNAHSSRSHTVFSITVHTKENTIDGHELLKTGKLNLVDLAGSENIGRSGAVDRRAREAGNINQSLLTLGRVITALVERAPHIPYRESKLTRLLQESLGGRTKTSIIATVSPANINLEETLSTLDYAHRARNITNRPEINQKLSKKELIKEYTAEIEKLRKDLAVTRERNGIYLTQENYDEMQATLECRKREIEEKGNHIKTLQETQEKLFIELNRELHKKDDVIKATQELLKKTANRLKLLQCVKNEQKYLLDNHVSTEATLTNQAMSILNAADTAATDVHKLHDKISRKTHVEDENEKLSQQFRVEISKRCEYIDSDFTRHAEKCMDTCALIKDKIEAQMIMYKNDIDAAIDYVSKDLLTRETTATEKLTSDVQQSYAVYQEWLVNESQRLSQLSDEQCALLKDISIELAPRIRELFENGIPENLKSLNNDVAKKFRRMELYVNENFECIYNSVRELKTCLQDALTERDSIKKKEDDFSKVVERVWHQLNDLNVSRKKSDAILVSKLNEAVKMSEKIDERKSLKGQIHDDIETIRNDIASGLDRNCAIVEERLVQGDTLVSELQSELKVGCDLVGKLKSAFHSDMKVMGKEYEDNEIAVLDAIRTVDKIVADASVNHDEFMERQKIKLSSATADISRELDDWNVQYAAWHNEIACQLRTTHQQMDKFITEDLLRDVPTGSTPVRREYQYPRQLAQTSPHNRILKRFRTLINYAENSDDDDATLDNTLDMTLENDVSRGNACKQAQIERSNTSPNLSKTELIVTPDLRCVNSSGSNGRSNLRVCNSSSNITSHSDVATHFSNTPNPRNVRSRGDFDIKHDNKENGDDRFVKPKQRGDKGKSIKFPKQDVLGTFNRCTR